MTEKVTEVTGKKEFTALADTGYYNGEDIAACEGAGVTCLVKKAQGAHAQSEAYSLEKFTYDRERDCYICPRQKELKFTGIEKNTGNHRYFNCSACGECPETSKCTKGRYREIRRPPHQNALDLVDERTKNNHELYRKRAEIVEHPFGTVKKIWGYSQFLCRGKSKVTGEMSLAYLAYNIRRVFNIFKHENRDIAAEMAAAIHASFIVFYLLQPKFGSHS